jgi:opacity protein-like surface antigen
MSIRTHADGGPQRTQVTGRMLPPASLWLAALLAVTLLVGFAADPVQAAPRADNRDWNREGDTLAGAVGLHYGKIGGTGLAFRLPLRWFLYAQVAGGIWHTNDDQRHNVGVQLQYLLRQDARLRLFTGVGIASYYHREKTGTGPDGDIFAEKTDWNYGAGVGVEILQGSRWAWLFELDFVHEEDTGNTTVSPQAGLSYYW